MTIAASVRAETPSNYIEARRRRYPPKYQTEAGWNALFRLALALAPPALSAMAARGEIAGGEIGELTPTTYVTKRTRGYAIEMHSGMMRLIYGAARAMTASDSGRFRDDKTPALTLEQVAEQIADLFRNYEKNLIATVQVFPATKFQTDWAHKISVGAEQFLLMHELAHIYNGDFSWWRRNFVGVHRQEIAADAAACRWMVDYVLNPKPDGPPRQLLYAGAEFGLRIRMAMETVGMRFESSHPAAGDRVAAMRKKLRWAAGPRLFYAIANTSLAFDQMWRAVELILKNQSPRFEPQLDDILADLRTLVVELVRADPERKSIQIKDVPGEPGRKRVAFTAVNDTQRAIFEAARSDFRDLAPELRRAAIRHAGDVFEPGTVEYGLLLSLLNL